MKFFIKIKDFLLFLLIVAVLSIVIDVTVISLAQEEEEVRETQNFECYDEVLEALVAADLELSEFLEDTFTSAEPTSELIDLVLEKYYVEYLDTVETILSDAIDIHAGDNTVDVSNKVAACDTLVNKHIDANAQILAAQVASSASAKKTTALLDEYKWINERLSEMVETVSLIGAYLQKVDDGLPGFTKNCPKG